MFKKDIDVIRDIIYDIEPMSDFYESNWLAQGSVETAIKEIIIYLEQRGYKIQKEKSESAK